MNLKSSKPSSKSLKRASQLHSPQLQAAKCLSPVQIEDLLRDKQIQPTLQRVALARYILCEADHPTAEDVHAWAAVHIGKISLATTYNTLNTLVAAGLLKMFRFPHSDKVFYDCNTHHHFHFYDENTGAIYDLAPETFDIAMNLPKTFSVASMDLVVRGSILKNSNRTEDKPTKRRR